MVNLQKTIALNPRQFEAYAELAGMLEDYGDKAGALRDVPQGAWRSIPISTTSPAMCAS